MTKQKLQAELKEKVKAGIKPSHLKRSKSLNDIPKAPSLPNQPNVQQLQPEAKLLKAQNKELKEQLTKVNQDWTNLAQNRVDNLKVTPHPRLAELEQELNQTVNDATEEITKLETENKQLRTKLTQATDQNQDLTQQVKEYQRAAELRITEPHKEPDYNWWADYGPVILLLVLYTLSAWLLNKPRNNHYER